MNMLGLERSLVDPGVYEYIPGEKRARSLQRTVKPDP